MRNALYLPDALAPADEDPQRQQRDKINHGENAKSDVVASALAEGQGVEADVEGVDFERDVRV